MKTFPIMILACFLITAQAARSAELDGAVCLVSGERAQVEEMQGRALTQEELFKKSYDEAGCLRQAAADVGVEWLETENLLRRSLQESEEGHWESALALLEKARVQAEQALRQAEHEAEAWKHRVVK